MTRQTLYGPRVVAWLGDEKGPSLWRVLSPFTRLQQRGYVADYYPASKVDEVLPLLASGFYQLIVMPRMMFTDRDALLRWRHGFRRHAVCFEADDDFFSPSIVPRQKATVEQDKSLEELEKQRQGSLWMLEACDGVTVSTDRLATVVRQYTDRPVCVVPNAIDTKFWKTERRRHTREIRHLTIGWSGGMRPGADLGAVGEAWRRVHARYPDVHFVVQGRPPPGFVDDLGDRLHVLPWLPVDWSMKLESGELVPPYCHGLFEIDVGCASVEPRFFNFSKSPIKLWEYTLGGAASVVSPTVYGDYVDDGVDGLVAETADEWEDAISRLVEDPALRKRLYLNQRRRVASEHSLEQNLWRWPDAWAEIYASWWERPSAGSGGAASRLVLPA